MPGAGEFPIGDSAPVETRIGVSGKPGTYDKLITGPHFGLDAEIASQPVAGQSFATKLGLFQKCLGISWGGKARFSMGWSQSPAGFNSMKHVDVESTDKTKLTALTATDDDTSAINQFGNKCFVDSMAGGLVGADETGKGGTPSFVAALDPNSTVDSAGVAHSPDGINWGVVFTLPQQGGDAFDGSQCFLVHWDGKQFWGQAGLTEVQSDGGSPPVITVTYHDILLSSAEGEVWSVAGDTPYDITAAPLPEPNALLIAAHLDQRYTNQAGVGAPSGLFGVKKKSDGTEIVIHPTANNFLVQADSTLAQPNGSTSVTIKGGDKPGTASVGFDVACVAYGSGSIWLAAGGAPGITPSQPLNIAISDDDGQTWTTITPPTMPASPNDPALPGVVGAAGAALSLFK